MITEYIGIGLVATIVTGTMYYKNEVSNLELELLKAKTQHNVCLKNKSVLEEGIEYSNRLIRQSEIDLRESMVELDTWKNKPSEVRYEVIYKNIPSDRNYTGECDETVGIVNAISNISFDDL